jgi:hypothetical protein
MFPGHAWLTERSRAVHVASCGTYGAADSPDSSPPQLRHRIVDLAARGRGRIGPQHADQLLGGHPLAVVQQQRRQHGPLPRAADAQRPAAGSHLDRTENQEFLGQGLSIRGRDTADVKPMQRMTAPPTDRPPPTSRRWD